jgi:tRNA threonylcarbamoyladenosine biosynthesis protein TsaB
MKILALEFSSDQRSVAIAADGIVRAVASEKAARDSRAFALIEQALAEAHLEREEIECLAVGLGPGSYTGIRSAIALAQGWQLALNVKLLGISTVDCLARAAQEKEWFGRVNLVIDAQGDELYFAGYEISAGASHEVELLRLITPGELRSKLRGNDIIAGPDVNRWFEQGRTLTPDAAVLARLAANRSDFVPGEKIEPIYLRETNFVKAAAPRIISSG